MWEEEKGKLPRVFPGSQCLRPQAHSWAPSSGSARGRGQRARSRQPQGTRARGGGAPVAVAGHARLRARLLKHGGSGVKTIACSRESVTSVIEFCCFCQRDPRYVATLGPLRTRKAEPWRPGPGHCPRAGGRLGALRGASRVRNAPSTALRGRALAGPCTPVAHFQRPHLPEIRDFPAPLSSLSFSSAAPHTPREVLLVAALF